MAKFFLQQVDGDGAVNLKDEKGKPFKTLNSNDNIYQDELVLDVSQTSNGYAAAFDIGLQLD